MLGMRIVRASFYKEFHDLEWFMELYQVQHFFQLSVHMYLILELYF